MLKIIFDENFNKRLIYFSRTLHVSSKIYIYIKNSFKSIFLLYIYYSAFQIDKKR